MRQAVTATSVKTVTRVRLTLNSRKGIQTKITEKREYFCHNKNLFELWERTEDNTKMRKQMGENTEMRDAEESAIIRMRPESCAK